MLKFAKHISWLLAIRGIAALIFGLLALALPEVTLGVLILLFGAYALVDGVFAVFGSIFNSDAYEDWWLLLLVGLLSILVGVFTFVRPEVTTLVLLFLIAARALVIGVLEIAFAIRLRKTITNEWLLILGGVFSVIFGLLLFAYPFEGALAVVWLIGIYAILYGVLMLVLASQAREWVRRLQAQQSS
jgi:uncharacterized membrane protein HdeD (DUF308 family)